MSTSDRSKQIVREKYAEVATRSEKDSQDRQNCSCCGNENKIYDIMMDDYSGLDGYVPEADLGLGCGLPTELAALNSGDTVVDLGSGAGNDCFVARHEVGPEGRVIGIDFTPEMVTRARANAAKLGFSNVEFWEGDIDKLPLEDKLADVVISNCVLNLVPDKARVFAEIFRILKPGGHFSISDIVLVGTLPAPLRADAELYAGCVAGAVPRQTYLDLIAGAGFKDIEVQRQKEVKLPDDVLRRHLDSDAIEQYKGGQNGIFSITVQARKGAENE
jgi:arsenite methyltransferase